MDRYRILSLDGGGSWALIQVKALIKLYSPQTSGHDVLADFDLAAANSGGSIVLACLIRDFSLQQTFDFFNDQNQREAVFSKTGSIADRVLRDLLDIGPKYSADNKLVALRTVLNETGDLSLPDAVKGINGPHGNLHVLITAFDYDRNRSTFFRSQTIDKPSWGYGAASGATLAEAVHASTNAPVNYFDGPATFPARSGRYWDGAIAGCNNPIVAAATEAIGLGQQPNNVIGLSIGTASVALPWPQPGESPSAYTWPLSNTDLRNDVVKLAGSILDDPPDIATFIAHVMTGSDSGLTSPEPDSRIVRMNPLISPIRAPAGSADPWTAPGGIGEEQFNFLKNLDMDAIEQEQVDAIVQYTDLWLNDAVMNQPIRMNGDTLKCEVGQEKFSAARAAWQALK